MLVVDQTELNNRPDEGSRTGTYLSRSHKAIFTLKYSTNSTEAPLSARLFIDDENKASNFDVLRCPKVSLTRLQSWQELTQPAFPKAIGKKLHLSPSTPAKTVFLHEDSKRKTRNFPLQKKVSRCQCFQVLRVTGDRRNRSAVHNSFHFGKEGSEFKIRYQARADESAEVALGHFHEPFPHTAHVRCGWRLKHPLDVVLLQPLLNLLKTPLCLGVAHLTDGTDEICAIVRKDDVWWPAAVDELTKHHDEVIRFQRWGYLQVHGPSRQTSEETSPPLSCSTTVLHVERSEKVDTGLAERRLIGCDPCFRKRGHLLRQRGCVDPATTRAMPNNVLGQSASIHDPKLASALGECLLPTHCDFKLAVTRKSRPCRGTLRVLIKQIAA